jgi:hypothetical protein
MSRAARLLLSVVLARPLPADATRDWIGGVIRDRKSRAGWFAATGLGGQPEDCSALRTRAIGAAKSLAASASEM